MKKHLFVGLVLISLVAVAHYQYWTALQSVQSLASQFESQIQGAIYGLQTQEGLNMDCLKVITGVGSNIMGVFHSSKEQKDSGYNALYLTQQEHTYTDANWTKIVKLSQRGSQGYIYHVKITNGFLVLYEIQNHEHGNTVAIRYYETLEKLKVNNFLYEYQLNQKIDQVHVRNIGTPSVQNVSFIVKQFDLHKSRLNLTLKFHYSPDGQKDLPGLGTVDLNPLRDFIDSQGQWKGGSKEKYSGWFGNTDSRVQQAIARLGPYSKIGQRDMFTLVQDGVMKKYYLYEVNFNPQFNWKDWRIVLYSERDNVAARIMFYFEGDEDVANPRISAFGDRQNGDSYIFYLSFFLPSEGVIPGTRIKAGQMTALVTIKP